MQPSQTPHRTFYVGRVDRRTRGFIGPLHLLGSAFGPGRAGAGARQADATIQYIDVRDLPMWIVHAAETVCWAIRRPGRRAVRSSSAKGRPGLHGLAA
jgi:hypothetical protein